MDYPLPEISTIGIFIIATLILLLTPGPAVLYIVARSVDQGRLAGLVSVLGVSVGTLFHVVAAAAGISALLASSVLAFNVLKYLGAAYLVYLGVRKFLERDDLAPPQIVARRRLSRVFIQGTVVNLLNPKTALFFLTFLPQFVNVTRGSVPGQLLFLGLLFIALGLVTDSLYALLAGTVGAYLRGNLSRLQAQRYFAGSVYIGLGLATAVTGADKK